jgi:DNA-binding CsgD family transcriptional regulator
LPPRRRKAGGAGNGRAPADADRNERLARIAARYGLTPEQTEVAGRILDGATLKEIAHDLKKHRRTIADRVSRLKRKTGSTTLAQLAARLGVATTNETCASDVDTPLRDFAVRHGFTPRQTEVVGLLVGGKTIPEVARCLKCAETTVKGHLDAVRRKAGARRCAEIAAVIAGPNCNAR